LINIPVSSGKVKVGDTMRVFVCGMLIALLILVGCSGGKDAAGEGDPVGRVERGRLSESFLAAYDTVHVPSEYIGLIQQAGAGVETMVFFGQWCSDSRRDVPRFLKIVDLAGKSLGQVTLYALDRKKRSPDGLEGQYHIERVPTFVFLKQGKEIGRIVEMPRTTLEGDMLGILAAGMHQ
jgi:thioredoxin 1